LSFPRKLESRYSEKILDSASSACLPQAGGMTATRKPCGNPQGIFKLNDKAGVVII